MILLILIQGELQHKMIKHHFAHMNKRNYMPQLAAAEVHERFMQRVSQRIRDHVRLAQVGGHRMWHQK